MSQANPFSIAKLVSDSQACSGEMLTWRCLMAIYLEKIGRKKFTQKDFQKTTDENKMSSARVWRPDSGWLNWTLRQKASEDGKFKSFKRFVLHAAALLRFARHSNSFIAVSVPEIQRTERIFQQKIKVFFRTGILLEEPMRQSKSEDRNESPARTASRKVLR